jgi:hypothetical protein
LYSYDPALTVADHGGFAMTGRERWQSVKPHTKLMGAFAAERATNAKNFGTRVSEDTDFTSKEYDEDPIKAGLYSC